MKPGDLVRCTWQPRGKLVNNKVLPMKYFIRGEIGVIIGKNSDRMLVMFPQFNGYVHELSTSVLEEINDIKDH